MGPIALPFGQQDGAKPGEPEHAQGDADAASAADDFAGSVLGRLVRAISPDFEDDFQAYWASPVSDDERGFLRENPRVIKLALAGLGAWKLFKAYQATRSSSPPPSTQTVDAEPSK